MALVGEHLGGTAFLDHHALVHEDQVGADLAGEAISWVTTIMVMPFSASFRIASSTSPTNSGSSALAG